MTNVFLVQWRSIWLWYSLLQCQICFEGSSTCMLNQTYDENTMRKEQNIDAQLKCEVSERKRKEREKERENCTWSVKKRKRYTTRISHCTHASLRRDHYPYALSFCLSSSLSVSLSLFVSLSVNIYLLLFIKLLGKRRSIDKERENVRIIFKALNSVCDIPVS